jgi:peroxiredoxin Q/BCP
MKLHAGQPAKLFTTTDISGATVALENYRGRYTLLSFLRSASCQLCNLRIHYLIGRYPELQARSLNIITIFETSVATTERFAGNQRPPFPLIANPDHDLYRLYGVERSLWGFITGFVFTRRAEFSQAHKLGMHTLSDGNHLQLPADFLLNPDLTIARAYYGRDIGDHLPLNEIEQFLATPVPVLT